MGVSIELENYLNKNVSCMGRLTNETIILEDNDDDIGGWSLFN